MNILVVGAGFAGACIARTIAEAGHQVIVIDKRDHIGGNAYDYVNSRFERIHKYGPHLFHGDRDSIAVKWLSRYTDWVKYEHRVLAQLKDGRFTPIPINRKTLEDIFNRSLSTEDEAKLLLKDIRLDKQEINNSDDVFLNSVGEHMANIFFRPYTRKMWGVEASYIEAGVAKRIAVRTSYDDRYFTDSFQNLPANGYSTAIEEIFRHDNIRLELDTALDPDRIVKYDHAFLCCPIDHFFNYKFGKLPYRSIMFENRETKVSQPSTTVNFTDEGIYTRSTQWDLLPNSKRSTAENSTITMEVPCSPEENNNEYYYPVRNKETLRIYEKYIDLVKSISYITFCGRTGLFQYLDMVPAINIHLQMAKNFLDDCN